MHKPTRAALALTMTGLVTIGASITSGAAQAAPAPAIVGSFAMAAINGAVTSLSVVQTTAAQETNVTVKMGWKVPNGTNAGDTFTVKLGPDALWDSIVSSGFDLVDPATGSVVATASVNNTTHVVTFTMTSYAESHINVVGTANWMLKISKTATLGTNPITFTVNGSPYTPGDTINVTAGSTQGDNSKIGGVEPDGPDADNLPDGMAWTIMSAPATAKQTIHLVDTPVPGLTLDCTTIVVRISTSTTGGTSTPSAITSCSATQLVIDAPVNAGQRIIVRGLSPFPTGAQANDAFTNNMTVTVDGTPHSDSTTVKYPDQGGTGTGDQFVQVGDYVWKDMDHNGVQGDAGDLPFGNVGLVISRTDGQPVLDYQNNPYPTTTTTDVDGLYLFTNLHTLPAGVFYKVTVDPTTVPSGWLPTLTGEGTTATDSSTGSATSKALTTLGDEDMTLDFGYWQPAPSVDIEKVDAKGNDADTAATKVDLGTAPGTTGITYTITNNGNEDLTNVNVSDAVKANGTVTGLSCTFPDGSKGTVYAGVLAVSASFTCTATLAGVAVGTDHQDTGSVTGEGVVSGTTVKDDDDYWAYVSKVPSVSVGDTVWNDTLGHDNRQGAGDTPISGVKLSVSRSDGQPALNADGSTPGVQTTDANGKYLFAGLAVLPAGVFYTVTLDPASVPAGLVPVTPNVGDRAGDSDTGSATSTALTTDGASDLTLDFGFWAPAPAIDIEKVDANGNDADTLGTSVDLGNQPGSTGITYTITNNGTEALKNVNVTDAVKANGTVTGLSCSFPDGTKGTIYAGVLAVNASFTCTANLAGVMSGAAHQDTGSVTGVGVVSGTTVKDDDDYYATAKVPASVSIGDTVWDDTLGHDNRQGPGDVGIPGVKLTVSRSDGKPALNADGSTPAAQITDANGKYTFAGLAVLPAGVFYIATIDPSTVPTGFIPVTANVGDRAGDSDTGSATSTALTTDGASDPTLDFGYWKPAPAIDIEKVDAKGNDADTQATKVDLGTAPGTTGITYIIKNTGTEDLTNVSVADVVKANGVVDGLSCTFPDGSKGTLFTGVFAVSATFNCTATLNDVQAGTDHQDTGSVEGVGVVSKKLVTDNDDYWASVKAGEVCVGDWVFLDNDGNNVQSEGDTGIPGVTLTVTRSDGQPALNADGSTPTAQVTDGNGAYHFCGLAILPAGVHYDVTLDGSTLPPGLTPVTPGVGTPDKDSSTGHATSTDLTKDGDVDDTLDFGFTKTKTVTIQLDEYGWGSVVGKKPSLTYGTRIAGFDNDSILKFGEDFWVGAKRKPYNEYTTKRSTLIQVTVASNATNADIITELNKAIALKGNWKAITTTAKLGTVKANGVITDAFVLGKGATLTAPFGPNKDVPQTYLGRSVLVTR